MVEAAARPKAVEAPNLADARSPADRLHRWYTAVGMDHATQQRIRPCTPEFKCDATSLHSGP